MRIATTIVTLGVLSALAPGAAAAEETSPYLSVVCEDLGDQPPKVQSRDACRAKLTAWQSRNCKDLPSADEQTACQIEVVAAKKNHANLKNVLRPDIHAEDANLMTRNYRHVIIAYAGLWIFAVIFLVLLFLRQRGLNAEITRLSSELDRALREEEE